MGHCHRRQTRLLYVGKVQLEGDGGIVDICASTCTHALLQYVSQTARLHDSSIYRAYQMLRCGDQLQSCKFACSSCLACLQCDKGYHRCIQRHFSGSSPGSKKWRSGKNEFGSDTAQGHHLCADKVIYLRHIARSLGCVVTMETPSGKCCWSKRFCCCTAASAVGASTRTVMAMPPRTSRCRHCSVVAM